jgi:hypothetical protein
MADVRDRFILRGEFPYFRYFLGDPDAIMANIRKGLILTHEPFMIRRKVASADTVTADVRFPGQPRLVPPPTVSSKEAASAGYTAFILGDDVKYLETAVLSDLYQEQQRMKARRLGKASPLQWWSDRLHREQVWALVAAQGPPTVEALRLELYRASKENAPEANQFFPSLVVSLLRFFFGENRGVRVLDPSAGWGDRLLGAIAAGVSYLGFDPNAALQPGYEAMIARFGDAGRHRVVTAPFDAVSIVESAASAGSLAVAAQSFDMVLSSPPFFDYEHYDDAGDQSDVRFRSREAWLSGFYEPWLRKACRALKTGGVLCLYVLNVAPVAIADETARIMRGVASMQFLGTIGVHTNFWPYCKSVHLRTPPKYYTRPLFVWQKRGATPPR